MDDYTAIALLYDYYGNLLTKRQREVTELYYEDNLSLSEIAEEIGISRQGVYDALGNAKKALTGYEEKLGLVARFKEHRKSIKLIDAKLDELTASEQDKASIGEIKKIIEKLLD